MNDYDKTMYLNHYADSLIDSIAVLVGHTGKLKDNIGIMKDIVSIAKSYAESEMKKEKDTHIVK